MDVWTCRGLWQCRSSRAPPSDGKRLRVCVGCVRVAAASAMDFVETQCVTYPHLSRRYIAIGELFHAKCVALVAIACAHARRAAFESSSWCGGAGEALASLRAPRRRIT